jgi:hypothetical protein
MRTSESSWLAAESTAAAVARASPSRFWCSRPDRCLGGWICRSLRFFFPPRGSRIRRGRKGRTSRFFVDFSNESANFQKLYRLLADDVVYTNRTSAVVRFNVFVVHRTLPVYEQASVACCSQKDTVDLWSRWSNQKCCHACSGSIMQEALLTFPIRLRILMEHKNSLWTPETSVSYVRLGGLCSRAQFCNA